jgi:hypothetical protein
VDVNRTWERSAKESLGCYELEKHEPWFDEWYSELLDQRELGNEPNFSGCRIQEK